MAPGENEFDTPALQNGFAIYIRSNNDERSSFSEISQAFGIINI